MRHYALLRAQMIASAELLRLLPGLRPGWFDEVLLIEHFAPPSLDDIHNRPALDQSIQAHDVSVRVSYAAMTDILADLCGCVGAVQGNVEFVKIDLRDAKSVSLIFDVRLDWLLFRIYRFGRYPLRIQLLVPHDVTSRRRASTFFADRIRKSIDSDNVVFLQL